jgi:hypothetical protein
LAADIDRPGIGNPSVGWAGINSGLSLRARRKDHEQRSE